MTCAECMEVAAAAGEAEPKPHPGGDRQTGGRPHPHHTHGAGAGDTSYEQLTRTISEAAAWDFYLFVLFCFVKGAPDSYSKAISKHKLFIRGDIWIGTQSA